MNEKLFLSLLLSCELGSRVPGIVWVLLFFHKISLLFLYYISVRGNCLVLHFPSDVLELVLNSKWENDLSKNFKSFFSYSSSLQMLIHSNRYVLFTHVYNINLNNKWIILVESGSCSYRLQYELFWCLEIRFVGANCIITGEVYLTKQSWGQEMKNQNR